MSDYWRKRVEDARAAYLAGDWDALETALGIKPIDEGDGSTVAVSDLRDRAAAGAAGDHDDDYDDECTSPVISHESWGGGDLREVPCGECEACKRREAAEDAAAAAGAAGDQHG